MKERSFYIIAVIATVVIAAGYYLLWLATNFQGRVALGIEVGAIECFVLALPLALALVAHLRSTEELPN